MVSSHDTDTGWGRCHCRVPGPDTDRSSESFSADKNKAYIKKNIALQRYKTVTLFDQIL